ncbi:MAG: flagellar motor protein MotB [Deltaproteobacteria bacterium]|nr:flagellar motor protein MotB [Deltaproteobacteria bacterium]
MADAEKRPIIIIKKKGHGGHGHHGGAWKVAFADFVTAMMALFMVLWLVAQSPQTKSAVGAYFRDPLGIESGGNTEINTGPNTGGAGFFGGGNTAVAVDTSFSAGNGAEQRPTKELPELSNARSRLTQALMALHMDSWARHVELTAVEDGLRIEIQDSDDLQLFAPGSTKIAADARPMLTTIAKEVGLLPNHVVIEGHTDASPASGRVDNWVLSTERANAARKFLLAAGVRDEQVVEVRGYAERRPRLWHKPEDARNRRISILVMINDQPGREGDEPESGHPLIQRLRALDLEAQGPSNELELEPDGKVALPP